MSILFEAWRRARGGDARLAETLGAPPPGRARRRSALIPWLLACVLAAVAAGLGVYLWRIERASPPRSAAAAPASAAAESRAPASALIPSAGPQPQATLPALAASVPRPAVPLRTPATAAVPAYVATSAVAAQAPVSGSVSNAGQGQAAAKTEEGGTAASPPVTTGGEVPEDVRAALPALDVTVHVWNPDPERSFIVIGGRIFRAGDEVAPGVKLVAITRDGETVLFRGYRIELPGS